MDQVECFRGNDWPIELVVKVNGSVVDISTYVAKYALKELANEKDDYVIDPTDLTCAADGSVKGNITPDVTGVVAPGKYIEEVKVYLADESTVQRFQRIRVVKPRVIVPPVAP